MFFNLQFAILICNLQLPVVLANDLRENVGLAEDLVLFAVDFDFGAAVFAVDDFVADFDGEFAAAARIEQLAGARGDDLAALRLFLGRIWQARCRRRSSLRLRAVRQRRDHRGDEV